MEKVSVYEKDVVIPTYEAGEPDRNPLFMEKRVYQGSSGKVYPYPVTVKISRKKTDHVWHAVFLENQYLKVMVLPELGGRIQRAYDKTNGYDFVYYNHVIKPALVGLTGPWISGGIEFNWPQHHRPTTFMPVDHLIRMNEDGSGTLLVNDTDQIYGTSGMASITLYPDKAYIEIRGQLYNGTSLPQTFLWWANPAVAVNDDTQSIFPPDVHSVYDHGKRDVSRFPIATGTYYKHDYSAGVDISRYKNIPVPTSYMAASSRYDFVGGYDHGVKAGLLHVADHHLSPGKKQWTWGCGDFGRAWDRNLTDSDGPYIELMTGVFTDNQPDFAWLKPFEEKTFVQYFMPYKQVGRVKNATADAVLGTEKTPEGFHVCVYATAAFPGAEIVIERDGTEIFRDTADISPTSVYDRTLSLPFDRESELRTTVLWKGRTLVSYQAEKESIPELATPAAAAREPEEIMTNEELYLTGQHIEQYRHATWLPDPYYLEGLKRDPGDIRINNAYGLLLLRRGDPVRAEKFFRNATERLTAMHPSPYNSETFYNLGLALFAQDRMDEAYDVFYKAAWTDEQQEKSFYYLAVISARKKDADAALRFIERSLIRNTHNIKARALKAVLLAQKQKNNEALTMISENLKINPFDYVSRCLEVHLAGGKEADDLRRLMRNSHENYLKTARCFMTWGFYGEALDVLSACTETWPMLDYYRGYCCSRLGREEDALRFYRTAEADDPFCCFPNKPEDIPVLLDAMEKLPDGAKSRYYLGCLCYDRMQYDRAVSLWEESCALDPAYPTAHRNLAIALYNKHSDADGARQHLEKAFALDPTDARVFLELDQLRKKMHVSPESRLQAFREHADLIGERDDLYTEYVTVLNLCGYYEEAYQAIMAHAFRPWEGAEGKISKQYKLSLLQMARGELSGGNAEEAVRLLTLALDYPENLGEGRLEGTKDNHIWYTMGLAQEKLGHAEAAHSAFLKACLGNIEPSGVLYYNDQPADMILFQGLAHQKLGEESAANACFYKLIDYGEKHIRDHVKMDYFAVSLPDFLIFGDSLDLKNRTHCRYLMGLGFLGLGRKAEAVHCFSKALTEEPSHQDAAVYLQLAKKA